MSHISGIALAAMLAAQATARPDDDFLWLEQRYGQRALAWVEQRNLESAGRLREDPRFAEIYRRISDDFRIQTRIYPGEIHGDLVHYAHGLRLLVADRRAYMRGAPQWRTVLDLGMLAYREGISWTYSGHQCLPPAHRRCLLHLAHGGSDAVTVREFDLQSRRFVDDGFHSPAAMQTAVWLDADHLLIATDFGPGTMNAAGHPRQVRLWRRGTKLQDARLLTQTDGATISEPFISSRPESTHAFISQSTDNGELLWLLRAGRPQRLHLPAHIYLHGHFGNRLIIQARDQMTLGDQALATGSLLAISLDAALAGNPQGDFQVLFRPQDGSLHDVGIAGDSLLITALQDGRKHLWELRPPPAWLSWLSPDWARRKVRFHPHISASLVSADPWVPQALVQAETFLQPASYHALSPGQGPVLLDAPGGVFDTSGLMVERKSARSPDGTQVPFFVIRHRNAPMDGTTPTLLHGYGGGGVAQTPEYLPDHAKIWLERGGAWAIADIRGGGALGTQWQMAANGRNRQRAFDDFIAVAEQLIADRLTSPRHLGITGASSGGLLVGAAMVQRPDLFNAAIAGAPLLDMLRYHLLPPGAIWTHEYGDPEIPEQRAWLLRYSPLHNLHPDTRYPEPLFYTATNDERVHPSHARRMAAKMRALGKPALYHESAIGGHGPASLDHQALMHSLQIVYALQKLSD